jgi:hypothetical protein
LGRKCIKIKFMSANAFREKRNISYLLSLVCTLYVQCNGKFRFVSFIGYISILPSHLHHSAGSLDVQYAENSWIWNRKLNKLWVGAVFI